MTERFAWGRDCGSDVSPSLAAQTAHEAGQTYTEYAEQYAAHWPFDEPPPPDLVEGMARDMEEAAPTSCLYCGVDDLAPLFAVPDVDDTDAWAALAVEHGPGCEWVETRAHRD